jgi:hypothetical protein
MHCIAAKRALTQSAHERALQLEKQCPSIVELLGAKRRKNGLVQCAHQLGDIGRDPARKVIALWPIKTVLCLKNARRKRSR